MTSSHYIFSQDESPFYSSIGCVKYETASDDVYMPLYSITMQKNSSTIVIE
jgi:hypothetical protein